MKNNESKFSRTLKKIGDFLMILMPIFSVGYYFWVRFSIPLVIFVSNYKEISLVGLILLSVGYIFTIFAFIYTTSISKPGIRIFGIIVLAFSLPLFIFSVDIFPTHPTVLDKAQISNTTYYLTGVIVDGHPFRDLYKCKKNHFACERTPFFSGGGSSSMHWHLMIDKTTDPNEVNVIETFFDGTALLEYTYGAQPRYYEYPAQLNDHLYYLAYPENFTYYTPTIFTLYECNLDNTSCKKLPIQYIGIGHPRDTIADEITGEINVFIEDQWEQNTLVFTWGENPRCYVEGCEILEEIK